MSALSVADRTKLARVLGMLGSSHAGERDAAGLAASRIVRNAGLSWSDLLQPQLCGPTVSSPDFSPPLDDLGLCFRNLRQLSPWEQNFILNLRGRSFLSMGQRQKLIEIATVLRKAGCR